jgi:hypothetical protein
MSDPERGRLVGKGLSCPCAIVRMLNYLQIIHLLLTLLTSGFTS